MPSVNPDILRWARETAGLNPKEAAAKLQIKPSKTMSASKRLAALESGEISPSRPQLVRMAKTYRRPLLTFYLSEAPRRGDRGQDFRTLPDRHSQVDNAQLDALIRDIRARQSMVRAVLEDEEEAEILSFVGSTNRSAGVQAVASSIRDTLKVSLDAYRARPSATEAFTLLRRGAEDAGVFVLLIGNLGSHHTEFKTEVFRGFALADEVAPFVVVNNNDSETAWSFTLLHELAHIWLGQTGVSGANPELAIERFCNDVAAEYLLPKEEFEGLSLDELCDVQSTEDWIKRFVQGRNLSHSMVAYRLFRTRAITKTVWRDLSLRYSESWRESKRVRRKRAKERQGGPDFYVVRGHHVGRALLELAGRMVTAGALTTCKAGKVLGVKAKQVQALLETGGRGAAHRSR